MTPDQEGLVLLPGKRLLITGVLTDDSIAWHTARIAQEQGAKIVLTALAGIRSRSGWRALSAARRWN
jgi:enoyl-[acyl-carrier-protein] reductase (NADH)